MSDLENNVPAEGQEGTQQPEVKVDPYEAKAMEMGWRPKDEWEGAEEDFIDAKEFVRRQPLFEKIEHQNKAIKQLEKAFDALKTHHTKVKESEYQRALKSLKEARKDALRDGETERALAYEEKIEEVEQQKAEFEQEVQQVDIPKEATEHPQFVSWKEQNRWYTKDQELREFADTYGHTLARKGIPPAEVLEKVAAKVRQAFPEKFRNPNKDKAGAVEPPTRRAAQSDAFELTDDEARIMKTIVRSGAMTEAEYKKELKRVKGL